MDWLVLTFLVCLPFFVIGMLFWLTQDRMEWRRWLRRNGFVEVKCKRLFWPRTRLQLKANAKAYRFAIRDRQGWIRSGYICFSFGVWKATETVEWDDDD